MALTVEAAELLELFQWLTPEESVELAASTRQRATEELADILIYLVRLGDVLGIDLNQAVVDKLARTAARYPIDRTRGSAAKARDLTE